MRICRTYQWHTSCCLPVLPAPQKVKEGVDSVEGAEATLFQVGPAAA